MKASIRSATPDDVSRVFATISKQSRDEIRANGTDIADVEAGYRAAAAEGSAYASVADGELLTVFGFSKHEDSYGMWSVGTERFFALGAPGVRETRRFFQQINLNAPLSVVTTSPHPDVERWLRLLGFRFSSQHGPAKVFWLDRHRET